MKNKFSYISVACISLCVIIVFLILHHDYNKFEIYKNTNYSVNKEKIQYNIDNIKQDNDETILNGWITKKGEDNLYYNDSYVLKDSKGRIYKIKSALSIRKDVTKYIDDGYAHDNSGVFGKFKNINLKAGELYTIGFLIINEDKSEQIIFTDKTITRP